MHLHHFSGYGKILHDQNYCESLSLAWSLNTARHISSSPNCIICSYHTPLPRSTQTNVRITRQSALDNFWTSAPVLITLIALIMDSYLNLFCSYDYIINNFYSLFKLWTKPSEILLSVCTSVSALHPNRNQNTTIHHVSSIYDSQCQSPHPYQ